MLAGKARLSRNGVLLYGASLQAHGVTNGSTLHVVLPIASHGSKAQPCTQRKEVSDAPATPAPHKSRQGAPAAAARNAELEEAVRAAEDATAAQRKLAAGALQDAQLLRETLATDKALAAASRHDLEEQTRTLVAKLGHVENREAQAAKKAAEELQAARDGAAELHAALKAAEAACEAAEIRAAGAEEQARQAGDRTAAADAQLAAAERRTSVADAAVLELRGRINKADARLAIANRERAQQRERIERAEAEAAAAKTLRAEHTHSTQLETDDALLKLADGLERGEEDHVAEPVLTDAALVFSVKDGSARTGSGEVRKGYGLHAISEPGRQTAYKCPARKFGRVHMRAVRLLERDREDLFPKF